MLLVPGQDLAHAEELFDQQTRLHSFDLGPGNNGLIGEIDDRLECLRALFDNGEGRSIEVLSRTPLSGVCGIVEVQARESGGIVQVTGRAVPVGAFRLSECRSESVSRASD